MLKKIFANLIPLYDNDKSTGEIRDAKDIPKHNKDNYSKPIWNSKLNGETLKAILLILGTRQVCPLRIYSR